MQNLSFALVLLLLASATASAQSGRHRWEVRWKRETWKGLAGKLKLDGREIALLDRGRPQERPAQKTRAGADIYYDPMNPPQHLDGLWVCQLDEPGNAYVQLAFSASSSNPYAGMYLSYALTGDKPSLGFSKESGKDTAWRLLNSQSAFEKRKAFTGKGAGPQYIETETRSFELEATNRPGWRLMVDKEGLFSLSNDPAARHTVTVTSETFWDDLNDGK